MMPMFGKTRFAFVLNMNRNEIVAPAADRQLARKVAGLKIGDEEHDCAAIDHLVQIIATRGAGSVPRLCGSKNRISRISRSVCERPFFAGM